MRGKNLCIIIAEALVGQSGATHFRRASVAVECLEAGIDGDESWWVRAHHRGERGQRGSEVLEAWLVFFADLEIFDVFFGDYPLAGDSEGNQSRESGTGSQAPQVFIDSCEINPGKVKSMAWWMPSSFSLRPRRTSRQ
jgi:hypothetical protein